MWTALVKKSRNASVCSHEFGLSSLQPQQTLSSKIWSLPSSITGTSKQYEYKTFKTKRAESFYAAGGELTYQSCIAHSDG